MADPQSKLQALSDEYNSLQTQLTSNVEARQKLESQQNENKSVAKEFAKLKDDANIYKLVGPVLLKQDKTEAVMAVDGRLTFIDKEILRIEKQIEDLRSKSESKRMEVCSSSPRPVCATLAYNSSLIGVSTAIPTATTGMNWHQPLSSSSSCCSSLVKPNV